MSFHVGTVWPTNIQTETNPISTKGRRRPLVILTMWDKRKTRRIPVALRCFLYNNQDFECEGELFGISTMGCQAQSRVEVEVGMELQLSVDIPNFFWPLLIDKAIVRWTNGINFGLEFVEILPAERDRLLSLTMQSHAQVD